MRRGSFGLIITALAFMLTSCGMDPNEVGSPTYNARAVALTTQILGSSWQGNSGEQLFDMPVLSSDSMFNGCINKTPFEHPEAAVGVKTMRSTGSTPITIDSTTMIFKSSSTFQIASFLQDPNLFVCVNNFVARDIWQKPSFGVIIDGNTAPIGLALPKVTMTGATAAVAGFSMGGKISDRSAVTECAVLVVSFKNYTQVIVIKSLSDAQTPSANPGKALLDTLYSVSAVAIKSLERARI